MPSSQVEIRAPAEQTEGTRSQILRWLKSVGDRVTENEPLIEIETDKVTIEVAAPGSGTLGEIVRGEQEEIAPGELLGRIQAEGAEGTEGAEGVQPVVAGGGVGAAGGAGASGASATGALQESLQTGGRPLAPAVKRLLAERGLHSTEVLGTGPGGRITVQDVLTHGATRGASRAGAAVSAEAPVAGGGRRVPHSATRKRIAEHMVQSLLHTAPHVTTVFEADLTAVLEHRQKNKDEFARQGVSLTLSAYFLRATVAALRAVPEANSRWTDSALEIFDSMHIGVATALETGLVVPVLRDVQSRGLFEIAKGLEDLISRARDNRLTPADVRGGTFTISNHGVSGSLVATPIVINQPQSAILGIGKLEKRPVVESGAGEDRIVIRPRCYVTLTIDHRVMDGHRANRFLQTFVEHLAASPT